MCPVSQQDHAAQNAGLSLNPTLCFFSTTFGAKDWIKGQFFSGLHGKRTLEIMYKVLFQFFFLRSNFKEYMFMFSQNIIVEKILLVPGARVFPVIHIIRRGRREEKVDGL